MATKDPIVDNSGDNIDEDLTEESVQPVVQTHEIDDSDDYLKRFDLVEASMTTVNNVIASLSTQPHDEARVKALVECVRAQQKVNEHLYDLLVEMNNFFGKSA